MEFNANEIVERIKNHCDIKDLAQIGISQQSVSNWKIRNSIPRADDLYKIAQFLNVSMEYLLTGENENKAPEEIELISHFRRLSTEEKRIINVFITSLSNK